MKKTETFIKTLAITAKSVVITLVIAYLGLNVYFAIDGRFYKLFDRINQR